jgi:hypothetical protein
VRAFGGFAPQRDCDLVRGPRRFNGLALLFERLARRARNAWKSRIAATPSPVPARAANPSSYSLR